MTKFERVQARRCEDGLSIANSPVFDGTMEDIVTLLNEEARTTCEPQLVVTLNVDQIMTLCEDDEFRNLTAAARYRLADGMPLVWLGKLLGARVHRITGADLLPAMCDLSARTGLRIGIGGGAQGVAERAVSNLKTSVPGANIVAIPFPRSTGTGTLDREGRAESVNAIRNNSVQMMFICLGSPKQEKWFLSAHSDLPPAVYIGAGAAVDFAAGAVRRAPRPLQLFGLEWLWRLSQEPRRMAKRYLVRDVGFLHIACRAIVDGLVKKQGDTQ